MARLNHHDLQQMDDAWQDAQCEAVVRALLKRVMNEFKTTLDRLNQTPGNSSRPSGSMPPWQRGSTAGGDESLDDEPDIERERTQPDAQAPSPAQPSALQSQATKQAPTTPPAHPGRRVGAPGHGREQKLLPSGSQEHRPLCCAACHLLLPSDGQAQAWTGWDTLEMVPLACTGDTGAPVLGVHIEVTRHLLMQQGCACGHTTRARALRAEEDVLWSGVQISEQRLLGPRLAAAVVHLCVRMRLPRRKVAEVLFEWFGLHLSAALIDQTVHQAARSVAPLEDELVQQLEQAVILHADETSWPEAGQALWLWVLCSCHTVLYMIGARTREMFDNALRADFGGTLMTDGYTVYRGRPLRLRCWAHLKRKTRGLAESSDGQCTRAGTRMLALFNELIVAVFEARKHLAQPPPAITHAKSIEQLRQLCLTHQHASHKALRELAREFLNDWDVIVRPLHDPTLPLTNNAAERQLRHYVIARRISFGTRTQVGSNSMALLASIIDTCRLRRANATELLACAIQAARTGLPAPTLPPIPTDLVYSSDSDLARV